MNDGTDSVRIEDLLAHREWLARLARRLVADPQTADDVIQQAWLAALRRPPRRLSRARAWLATVARNAVRERGRSEATRQRREERASRSDLLPDTAALVERAELRRHVAGLVLGLPEPLRTTLLLRFDEDLEPHEIARRTGIPASTVRGRLQRGLAQLREELDHAHGGNRKGWMTAMLPLIGIEAARVTISGGAIAVGGLIVGTKVKLALGDAILLVLVAGVSLFGPDSEGPEVPPPGRAASAGAPDEAAEDATEDEDPPEPAAAWAYIGQVVGPRRFPRTGVPVRLWLDGALVASTRSGEGGHFRLPAENWDPGGWATVVARAADDPGLCAVARSRRFEPRTEDLDVGRLVLRKGHPLEVVVESGGRVVPGAKVVVGPLYRSAAISGTTNADGRVRFEGLPPELYCVEASSEGLATSSRLLGVPRLTDRPVRIELVRPRTVVVEIVEAPDERPVADVGVRVSDHWGGAGHSSSRPHPTAAAIPPTDARGRTRIEGLGRDAALRLQIAARGYAGMSWAAGPKDWVPRFVAGIPIPTDEDRVRVVLPPARRVSWPVVAGEVPVPADGARIACRLPRRGPTYNVPHRVDAGRMEGGFLVVEGLLVTGSLRATAVTPDGAVASLSIDSGETEGPTISFNRPRALTIDARYEDASPAEGVEVAALHTEGWRLAPGVKTDASGEAQIEGLVAETVSIHARPSGMKSVTADLTAGDARVKLTIPPRRKREDKSVPLLLRVRLSGVKGLPAEYRIRGSRFRVEKEDPGEGLIHGRFVPPPEGESAVVVLRSPDHAPAKATIDPQTREATIVVDVETIEGTRPRPSSRLRVLLLRDAWDRSPVAELPASATVEKDGRWTLRFSGYRPGTWTLWCDVSRAHVPLVIEDVELGAGEADLGPVRLRRGSTFRGRLGKPVAVKGGGDDGPPPRRARGLRRGDRLRRSFRRRAHVRCGAVREVRPHRSESVTENRPQSLRRAVERTATVAYRATAPYRARLPIRDGLLSVG